MRFVLLLKLQLSNSLRANFNRLQATPFATRVPLLFIALLALTACATAVRMNARFPARNVSASELRKVAIWRFDGQDGSSFASALQAKLASTNFDGAPYFTLVGNGAGRTFRSAVGYGRSVGAQGVFYGRVVSESANNARYQGIGPRCVRSDGNGNCKKWKMVPIPCIQRTVQITVVPTLLNVSTGRVVYSSQKSGSAQTKWCAGQQPPATDATLVSVARARVLDDIRKDVAPYNAVMQATLKDSDDGLPKDAAAQFDAAVASAKKNDFNAACKEWRGVEKAAPNNVATVYDLGVCAEANGDYRQALSRYERARTLSSKADDDISASIARAQRLMAATGELDREQHQREEQAAAVQRVRKEGARRQAAEARARKSAAAKRHAMLVSKFGAGTASAIESGKVERGMSKAAVIAAKGSPSRKEVVPPDSELWHYGSEQVAFTKGRVTYISH